jgi:hypothetical protein
MEDGNRVGVISEGTYNGASFLGINYNSYVTYSYSTIGELTNVAHVGFIGNVLGTALGLSPTTVTNIDMMADIIGVGISIALAPVGIVGTLSKVSTLTSVAAKYGYVEKEVAFAINTISTAVSLVNQLNNIQALNNYASSIKGYAPDVAKSIGTYSAVATGLLAIDAAMFGYNTYQGIGSFGSTASDYGATLSTGSTCGENGNIHDPVNVAEILKKTIDIAEMKRNLWYRTYMTLDTLGSILAGGYLYNAGAGSRFYSVSDAFAPFQFMTGIMNPYTNREIDKAVNFDRYYDGMVGTDTYMEALLKGA